LCLICFCILGIALIVAILELAALPVLLKATGCQANFEILPNFTCGDGLVRRSIEIVINLPLLFVYAPAFTLFATLAPPSPEFRLLLYFVDVILALALTYPLLFLLARRSGRQSG
jgi:hypothetical protein